MRGLPLGSLDSFWGLFSSPRVPQIVRNPVVFGLRFAPEGATGFPKAHFGANLGTKLHKNVVIWAQLFSRGAAFLDFAPFVACREFLI